MQATTYLCYAKAGHEFEVTDELRALGIHAWCGRKVVFEVIGKDAKPRPVEKPYLPNYVFAQMTDEQFIAALGINKLNRTMLGISKGDMPNVSRFMARVDEAFDSQNRNIALSQKPAAPFDPGEDVMATDGPLAGQVATFQKLVNRDDKWLYECEVNIFGGAAKVFISPLDVKRAG